MRQVIKVEASDRTGALNFVTCMRQALATHFKDQVRPAYNQTAAACHPSPPLPLSQVAQCSL
jgi:hypothetical protein